MLRTRRCRCGRPASVLVGRWLGGAQCAEEGWPLACVMSWGGGWRRPDAWQCKGSWKPPARVWAAWSQAPSQAPPQARSQARAQRRAGSAGVRQGAEAPRVRGLEGTCLPPRRGPGVALGGWWAVGVGPDAAGAAAAIVPTRGVVGCPGAQASAQQPGSPCDLR